LNDVVERKSFKLDGSRFHARGAATQSPIFRLVFWHDKVTVTGSMQRRPQRYVRGGVSRLAM